MKIALLGDTHFGARNDNPAFHKFFAKFYDNVFFPHLEKEGIKHVIQLGDVFDRRKYINFHTFHQARRYFFDRLNADYESWLLVGNHDSYYKNTIEVNSVELLLEGHHNITPVHHVYDLQLDGIDFLLCPWWCEENDYSLSQTIATTKATHVIGHFELDGFEMYKGSIHQGGMTRNCLTNFEAVWSGHFHHQSKVDNIHYLGTPYEMTWSDYGDQKGFHVFDTETRELTFIPNPYSIFHKLSYDDLDKTPEEVMNVDFSSYSETFVKLIVKNKTNPYCFDLFVDKLEKAGVYSVQVVDDHFHMDTANDTDIVSEAEDTRTILTKYVRTLEVNDKQQLESLMLSLYEQALSVE